MAKQPTLLDLSEADREQLTRWVAAHHTPQQVVKRCRIVLHSADGQSDLQVARRLSINRHTCRLWRQRFGTEGIKTLWEGAFPICSDAAEQGRFTLPSVGQSPEMGRFCRS